MYSADYKIYLRQHVASFCTYHQTYSPNFSWCNYTVVLTQLQLERFPVLFNLRDHIVVNLSIAVHALPMRMLTSLLVMVCMIGGKWLYNCYSVGYSRQDLFKTLLSTLCTSRLHFSSSVLLNFKWCNHAIVLTQLQFRRTRFILSDKLNSTPTVLRQRWIWH